MNIYKLLPFICLLHAPPAISEDDVRVSLTVSNRTITSCTPVVAHVKVTNDKHDLIRLTSRLSPESGAIQFYARHAESEGFRNVPGALYCDLTVGGGGEIKKSDSRDIYTFLVPTAVEPFFDKAGEWYVHAVVAIDDVRGKSDPVTLSVKGLQSDPKEVMKLNSLLCESLTNANAFNSKFLGRILESPFAGEELRTITKWVDAIALVTEAPDEGLPERYKAACEIQSSLDKTSRALMAKQFSRRLVRRGWGDLAKEQALKLDTHSQREIQYSIDERRRNQLESKRPKGTD